MSCEATSSTKWEVIVHVRVYQVLGIEEVSRSTIIVTLHLTHLKIIFKLLGPHSYTIVGPRGLQSGPNSIWAQGPCRGRMISGRGSKGNG